MKILITTDWYRPVINGVVTSVLNLTEQLEKRGHEVKVLTLSRNCHSYKEENVIYAGSVGMGKIYPQARVKIPVVAREYMEELLAWKPDLIHSQCEFSTIFSGKKNCRRIRYSNHSHIPYCIRGLHTLFLTTESMGQEPGTDDDKKIIRSG